MKRIYVAGPMTGYPELNFPAFHAAAAALRAEGHHVENPAEINADPTAEWLDCMRADIARLVTCDAVFLLPGWERSRGARVEQALAAGLGLQVLYSEGAATCWPEGVPVAAWANVGTEEGEVYSVTLSRQPYHDTALVTLADAVVAIQKMAIEAPVTGGAAPAVQCVYLVETGEVRNGAELVERHEQMPRAGSDFEVVYKQPESCNSTTAAPAGALETLELGEYEDNNGEPHPVLLALSEHDDPCESNADALARIKALRAEIEHMRPFQLRAQAQEEAETDRLAAEYWREQDRANCPSQKGGGV
ncbi:DUF4406 domain-containing protein [Paracidovorax valerianellae]|uniref:DUF4406 domain-containing protein n=1 Tax=Paracidovorax valerianellae TaxID=187868 RepID=UPI00230411B3|nr:DUF4406 domain-containing protein [Paracidovorax valerianellae]MDA8444794.1 DUF4406 domain-containing protein [Paracidovorax valerianellae]UYL85550.1 hypothetical protein gp47 [Acidovorax phage Alfacinha1]